MRYDRIYKAKFIERPNRFIAYAELNGKKGNGSCEKYRKMRRASSAGSRYLYSGKR